MNIGQCTVISMKDIADGDIDEVVSDVKHTESMF